MDNQDFHCIESLFNNKKCQQQCARCKQTEIDDFDSFYESTLCHHHNPISDCSKCDAEMDARGGIEKCLNCGRIKYGDQLNQDQVCIRPCKNPAEY